jgi:hypothetical protein
MFSSSVRRLGCLGIAVALAGGFSPRAEASGDGVIPVLAAGALLPSEAGATMTTTSDPRAKAVLGWSWQLALGDDLFDAARRHHLVGGVNLLPGPGGKSWDARLGYRYSLGDLFVGAGPAVGARGISLSPEVGFKFAHGYNFYSIDPALHVLARADVAPDGLRGVTLLLGWSVF